MSNLIMVRNGKSIWKRENRYKRWADVELKNNIK